MEMGTKRVTLGKLLKDWRGGRSQRAMAEMVGAGQGNWSLWERDLAEPSLAHLRLIAASEKGAPSLRAMLAALEPEERAAS